MFLKVTWPVVEINATTPEDAVVVENCEFTGLCQTISPGGRTVTLEESTDAVTEMTELDTTTEVENIPTPARIFL